MSGFKNTSLNSMITLSVLNQIVSKVLACFEKMIKDCGNNSIKIANNETAIRDHLFYNYLNNDEIMRNMDFDNFRFLAETPENYMDGKPQGRTDLQVFSINEFRHRNRYFIIECKRIDGNLTLNREYIDEGIRRFVGESPKYKSYYKMNCMLGFIVRCINIAKNVEKINDLLQIDYADIHVQDYLCAGIIPNTYISSHNLKGNDLIVLTHAFVNCASVIN
jgi:hypothetical protein